MIVGELRKDRKMPKQVDLTSGLHGVEGQPFSSQRTQTAPTVGAVEGLNRYQTMVWDRYRWVYLPHFERALKG